MTEQQLYRRLVRRTRHRSRSAAVVVVLVVVILVAIYVGVESVLAALDRPALLVSPADALAAVTDPSTPVLAGAIVAAVLGIVLLLVAFLPGRRARHELPDDRMAVVIDDGVLAGAIANATYRQARVPADRIRTVVSRRSGSVRVTPTSGIPLDPTALAATVEHVVATLDPRPPLRVGVTIDTHGVVGS